MFALRFYREGDSAQPSAATERSYKSRFKNRVADPNLKVRETFPCNIRLSSEFLSNTFITRKTRLLSDGAHGEIGDLWKQDITDSLVICGHYSLVEILFARSLLL